MVSKRTTPDHRRIAARIAGAGSLAGVLWLTLALAGCPLREKEIRITEGGIQWLVSACLLSGGGPPPIPPPIIPGGPPMTGGGGGAGGDPRVAGFAATGGGGGNIPPPGGGGNPGGGGLTSCHLDGHNPATGLTREARLFLISPGDRRVRDASKCMSLHPCGDGGRSGPPRDCVASDLNQQLDGAMPNGLGFAGLQNPEEALLVIAFYQPTDTSEEGGGCHRADLYACAGLAPPLGGGSYDISCASCEGGPATAPGNDTGPCPRDQDKKNSCFLQTCDQILMDSGFD